MNKWFCSFAFFIMGIALFQGCGGIDFSNYTSFSFIESEQVVEVDTDTRSFRIIVKKWSDDEDRDVFYPPSVYIDTTNTTARHNVHFINHVDTLNRTYHYTIGDFTPIDSEKWYRDVELIPENIKKEKIIYYDILWQSSNDHNMIDRLKVILRPKTNKD